MFEVVLVLLVFGLLYIDIIELLEKCDRPETWFLFRPRGVERGGVAATPKEWREVR